MILILVPKITNRLRFTFNFIFRDILNTDIKLTVDTNEFLDSAEPKFSYGPHAIGSELFFQSRNILFETGITDQNITVFEHGEQGGTFNGSPLMTAVGCAVMETMLTPGFLPAVADTGKYLSERLSALVQEFGLSHERGLGLLRALDLGAAGAAALVAYARDNLQKHPGWENTGLLLNAPKPDALRFMPALNVTRPEIDQMIEGTRLAIQAVL